ncbi:protein-L-isoaspartate O-methyltransferase [Leptospira gomenensis]|uniref:Protein-L-isoaspartate O-methyltransferase n=1 Tax=Leptospira gomenensis TaxID=2484974 RepID=A0A5F1YAV6_9LEPT|nr:protein-L-isoaspartate O-methyltransferase [Leptospira gomenensis]TGK34543.1 protein-L-isoaspartate O-methyltransferase [Leptospira gomenensis]TGK40147.1 protein-L-isoaspartate O-methyltransferase [Leptospira gomenensis]TGK42676.1 protein-L-isoaspartate O-methyltransferase [Leptospira gomenensis]TGK55656.1 protein-L-isoaspartate O-methyltransferase [Leptospira gomenensis]
MSSDSNLCDQKFRREERRRMVRSQIEVRGIRDPRILDAMNSIPRECFVPQLQASSAYEDKPLPIGCGQTISQPFMVAWMSELLSVVPGDRIFEIGTGSGYQTAVLDFLGAVIVSVEFFPELHRIALRNLEIWRPGFSNQHRLIVGDGTRILRSELRFEKILSCAALPRMPDTRSSYFQALVPGGSFVFPTETPTNGQRLIVGKRTLSGWSFQNHGGVRFVPLLGAKV